MEFSQHLNNVREIAKLQVYDQYNEFEKVLFRNGSLCCSICSHIATRALTTTEETLFYMFAYCELIRFQEVIDSMTLRLSVIGKLCNFYEIKNRNEIKIIRLSFEWVNVCVCVWMAFCSVGSNRYEMKCNFSSKHIEAETVCLNEPPS